MIKIIYKNENLHNYLATTNLRSDSNSTLTQSFKSRDKNTLQTESNTGNNFESYAYAKTEGNASLTHKLMKKEFEGESENDQFYITASSQNFKPKKKDSNDSKKKKNDQYDLDEIWANAKKTTNANDEDDDVAEADDIVIERTPRKFKTNPTMIQKLPSNVIEDAKKHKTSNNIKATKQNSLLTNASARLSISKKYSSGPKTDFSPSLVRKSLFASLSKVGGACLTLPPLKLLEQCKDANNSQAFTESNDNSEVNKTRNKNIPDLSSFLNISRSIQKEIKNPFVRQLLKSVDGSGPRYQYCNSCNNHNIDFYNEMKPENSIMILQKIKAQKIAHKFRKGYKLEL